MRTVDFGDYAGSKPPVQSSHEALLELYEAQTIGALIHRPDLINQTDLAPSDFALPAMGLAFQAIQAVSHSNQPVDIITVAESLERSTGKNYLPILGGVMEQCVTPKNAKVYAKHVKQRSKARQTRLIAATLSANIGNGEEVKAEAIDQAIKGLMAINSDKANHECSLQTAVTMALERVDDLHTQGKDFPGISTGLADLDKVLGGFQNADLYIIAGRPALGKTALMLNMALAGNVPCGIFSAEQPRLQIGSRMLSIKGRVNVTRMRNGSLHESEWPSLTSALGMLTNLPIRIYDKPAPTITDLIRQARIWKHHHKIKILFVDYLQRISSLDRRAPRHERVGEVTMGLKELARTLDIPVIALAQVKREVEARPNKRPGMADMKDSGEIEQEADTIATIYRDEVYNPETRAKGIVEIALPKNRHGPADIIEAQWEGWCMRFNNLSLNYQAQSQV